MSKKDMKRCYEHKSHKEYVPEIQGKAKNGNKKAKADFYYTTSDGTHYTEKHDID